MPAAGLNRKVYNNHTCMYMYLLLQLHVNSSEIGHIEMLHHGYAYMYYFLDLQFTMFKNEVFFFLFKFSK